MALGKKHTAEQIVSLLRQIDRGSGSRREDNGAGQHKVLITEQTYYCWRKEFGGQQVDQARCNRAFRFRVFPNSSSRPRSPST